MKLVIVFFELHIGKTLAVARMHNYIYAHGLIYLNRSSNTHNRSVNKNITKQ